MKTGDGSTAVRRINRPGTTAQVKMAYILSIKCCFVWQTLVTTTTTTKSRLSEFTKSINNNLGVIFNWCQINDTELFIMARRVVRGHGQHAGRTAVHPAVDQARSGRHQSDPDESGVA